MSAGTDAPFTLRRGAEWALLVLVTVAVWFGPPILWTLYLIGAGTYLLVAGPQWFRLWLATALGAILITLGLVAGLALVIG